MTTRASAQKSARTRAATKWAREKWEAERAETTLPPMVTPEMAKALRAAGRKVQEWTVERDRLVKEAVEAGGSLREVGEAAGLSHTAVKFIAHGRP